jgi:hypothetical protein
VAAAPKSGARVLRDQGWGRLARVVKEHPLMAAISVVGTCATFIIGTTRVASLVIGGGLGGVGPAVEAGTTNLPSAPEYEYVEVSDETGRITVEVPTVWGDVPGDGWYPRSIPGVKSGARVGLGLNAAPNVEAWKEDLETPGVFIGASRALLDVHTPTSILRRTPPDGCSSTTSETYANADFTGEILTFACPDAGAEWRRLAATPTKTRDYLVYLEAKLLSSADVEAYNKILNTFEVDFDA